MCGDVVKRLKTIIFIGDSFLEEVYSSCPHLPVASGSLDLMDDTEQYQR